MTSLKAADAKEVASSVSVIANEKLKAEKEAAGKKKTGTFFRCTSMSYALVGMILHFFCIPQCAYTDMASLYESSGASIDASQFTGSLVGIHK